MTGDTAIRLRSLVSCVHGRGEVADGDWDFAHWESGNKYQRIVRSALLKLLTSENLGHMLPNAVVNIDGIKRITKQAEGVRQILITGVTGQRMGPVMLFKRPR